MKNPIKTIWARLTKNWRDPFDARQASFGYTDTDGTFYPGYMTRGGEMRYEKKGIRPTFETPEYVETRGGVQHGWVRTGLFSAQATKRDCSLNIYRQKNKSTGKYRYWEGSSLSIETYLDAVAYTKSKAYIPVEKVNEA